MANLASVWGTPAWHVHDYSNATLADRGQSDHYQNSQQEEQQNDKVDDEQHMPARQ